MELKYDLPVRTCVSLRGLAGIQAATYAANCDDNIKKKKLQNIVNCVFTAAADTRVTINRRRRDNTL